MRTAAYVRVSTANQTVEQQRDQIRAAGYKPACVFKDNASGAAGSPRPGWDACLGWLQPGDRLVVAAVDRLGRSVHEVTSALHSLSERGVVVHSVRENVDTSTAMGKVMIGMLASVAALELELGRERRAASRSARVARGLPATCPPKLSADQQAELVKLYHGGTSVSDLAERFEVSRRSVFRYVRQAKQRLVA
ncbi:recombinase family protein [Mycolicibacterium fallax]|uniref:Resolvase n=1 Tax=Mycolicibacterium fallax TaxID=1793 RepID=A0A1X1RJ27_MYCFA|nr:recombinase family protein [Mycolicibacterium fallax]ORV07521.1 resolvase [Mycolicibacterium fallax]BBY99433.1 putative resolvase/invertase/recombinase [Mycolicibacterium fallax]